MVRRKSVQHAKTTARGSEFLSGDPGLHHGPTPPYSPFSKADLKRIIDAAFDLMSQSGIAFDPDPGLMERLGEAGCDVSTEGLVKFPVDLIRKSIDSVAKSVKLWNRDGSASIEIDCQHTWFVPGMTCIKVYDEETGEARDSNREDLATVTRVSDAMQNVDAVCVTCKNVEESNIHGEIDEFSVLAENTTKPLIYLCEYARSLGVVIDMASAIRGGRKELVDKPYFMHLVTPLPLYYAKTHIEQIIEAVEAGVPVVVATDFNPGSCPTESMGTAISFACMTAGLTVDEAITAATLNAAHALGRADRVGSLEPGKRANLVVHAVPNRYHLVYRFGVPRVRQVIVDGHLVWDAPSA